MNALSFLGHSRPIPSHKYYASFSPPRVNVQFPYPPTPPHLTALLPCTVVRDRVSPSDGKKGKDEQLWARPCGKHGSLHSHIISLSPPRALTWKQSVFFVGLRTCKLLPISNQAVGPGKTPHHPSSLTVSPALFCPSVVSLLHFFAWCQTLLFHQL